MKNNKELEKKKDDRARSWVFIAYPESVPTNFDEILGGLGVPFARSPLHDKDLNPDGKPKKPHWHFVLTFSGKKSFEQVKEITDSLNAPIPQRCKDVRGAVRYFLHLDNPSKHDYSSRKSEILTGFGFDLDDALKLSKTEAGEILADLKRVIYDKGVSEFADLDYYVNKYHKEWAETLNSNCFSLCQIIKSVRNSKRVIDLETGEVVVSLE